MLGIHLHVRNHPQMGVLMLFVSQASCFNIDTYRYHVINDVGPYSTGSLSPGPVLLVIFFSSWLSPLLAFPSPTSPLPRSDSTRAFKAIDPSGNHRL